DRDRDIDGLGLHPGLDAAKACRDSLQRDLDLFERQRRATVAFGFCLALAGIVAVAIGARFRRCHLLRDFGRGRRLFARAVGSAEVGVEEEFRGCGHQYTSSSSARFLVRVISPLAARSLARLTRSACASSTSRRRTGPIAAMSSISILPARED